MTIGNVLGSGPDRDLCQRASNDAALYPQELLNTSPKLTKP